MLTLPDRNISRSYFSIHPELLIHVYLSNYSRLAHKSLTPALCCDLGEAYMRLNRLQEAGHWYRESLRAKADHIPAHLTYAKLLSITVGPAQNLQTHGYPDKKKVSSSFPQPFAGGTPIRGSCSRFLSIYHPNVTTAVLESASDFRAGSGLCKPSRDAVLPRPRAKHPNSQSSNSCSGAFP